MQMWGNAKQQTCSQLNVLCFTCANGLYDCKCSSVLPEKVKKQTFSLVFRQSRSSIRALETSTVLAES